MSIIAKLHQVLCCCLIDFLISDFRGDSVVIDKDLVELLHLSWQSMPVQGVFLDTREGLVNHCFEDLRLDRIISHLAIVNNRTCFFLGRSIIRFYAFLIVCFNADNRTVIAISSCLEKDLLLIFKMVIDRSW
ncbi:Uncharacterised protein [Streptococcus pneumoniae]|nr:Uncharacterised protein [Streptococcus pneumoniae]